jgi:hypothetical protein
MLEHSLSGPVTYKGAYASVQYMQRNGLPYMTGGHLYHGSPNSLDPTLIVADFCSFRGGDGEGKGYREGTDSDSVPQVSCNMTI